MRLTRLALALGLARARPRAGRGRGGERSHARRLGETSCDPSSASKSNGSGSTSPTTCPVLERILAPDFVATLADGAIRGKREHIAAYPADFEAFASVVASETKVRVFSPELAVVTGLYTATFRHPAGKEASGRYRYTDVWMLRAGAWQCVATQETQVP